jgi:hypothetical protein
VSTSMTSWTCGWRAARSRTAAAIRGSGSPRRAGTSPPLPGRRPPTRSFGLHRCHLLAEGTARSGRGAKGAYGPYRARSRPPSRARRGRGPALPQSRLSRRVSAPPAWPFDPAGRAAVARRRPAGRRRSHRLDPRHGRGRRARPAPVPASAGDAAGDRAQRPATVTPIQGISVQPRLGRGGSQSRRARRSRRSGGACTPEA